MVFNVEKTVHKLTVFGETDKFAWIPSKKLYE